MFDNWTNPHEVVLLGVVSFLVDVNVFSIVFVVVILVIVDDPAAKARDSANGVGVGSCSSELSSRLITFSTRTEGRFAGASSTTTR
jgi:hypothetical protein